MSDGNEESQPQREFGDIAHVSQHRTKSTAVLDRLVGTLATEREHLHVKKVFVSQ